MELIATKLKKIRLEKGLTLEEVNKKTKIHLNILKAIEEGSVVDLSPIYLSSFIKIYCKFLGVDPKEYLPGYKAPLPKPAVRIDVTDSRGKPASFIQSASTRIGSLRPYRKIQISLLVILGLILLLGVFSIGKIITYRLKLKQAKAKSVALTQPKLAKKPSTSSFRSLPWQYLFLNRRYSRLA